MGFPYLNTLRTQPHQTKLYLSIYKPTVLFSAQINSAGLAKGDTVIPYDGASGTYTNILPNFTMLVGTASGLSDVGRIRVKSADATNITVSENSNIVWADDLWLTVINFCEVWPIYTKLELVGDNLVGYKDGDIAYTNQNLVMGEFPCAGPNRAAFKDTATGSASIYYSASGTYNVSGDTMSYLWRFEGGTPSTGTVESPGWVTYDTPGHYRTTLEITSDAETFSTYRFVSIYDRPGDGYNTPIKKWELQSLDGSRDEGGFTAKIRVYDDTDDVIDGALVVLFADTWYGPNKIDIGGNAENNSSIKFNGYILKDSIVYNYQDGWVEFEVGSIVAVMKNAEGLGFSVSSTVGTPVSWFEINNMNVAKALFHYLRWHSTVLNIADFQYTGPDREVFSFDSDRTSMYDAVDNFMKSGMVGEITADMQGKLWAELNPSAVNNAALTFETDMSVTKDDWMNSPQIDEEPSSQISYLEAGGFQYASGTALPLLACAPGDIPSFRGKIDRQQGLILLNQTDLNILTGNIFAYKNARYFPRIQFAGNYSNLDIAPVKIYDLNISASDTPEGLVFTDSPFHIVDMAWQYDPVTSSFLPFVTFHQVTQGVPGDTIVIPPAPPDPNPPTPPVFPPIILPPIVIPQKDGISKTWRMSGITLNWVKGHATCTFSTGDHLDKYASLYVQAPETYTIHGHAEILYMNTGTSSPTGTGLMYAFASQPYGTWGPWQGPLPPPCAISGVVDKGIDIGVGDNLVKFYMVGVTGSYGLDAALNVVESWIASWGSPGPWTNSMKVETTNGGVNYEGVDTWPHAKIVNWGDGGIDVFFCGIGLDGSIDYGSAGSPHVLSYTNEGTTIALEGGLSGGWMLGIDGAGFDPIADADTAVMYIKETGGSPMLPYAEGTFDPGVTLVSIDIVQTVYIPTAKTHEIHLLLWPGMVMTSFLAEIY